jgi:hypothetical protein
MRTISEGCPSGQREQTVNLPAYAYSGSNPLPSTPPPATAGNHGDHKPPKQPSLFGRHESPKQFSAFWSSRITKTAFGFLVVTNHQNSLRLFGGTRGSSSVGRASAFQAECRRFEPGLPLRLVIPDPRNNTRIRPGSSVVEHLLGKEEVGSSILLLGSRPAAQPALRTSQLYQRRSGETHG